MSEMRSVLPMPLKVEQIDREWLTAALRVNAPGVTVLDFELVDVIHATSTSVKLRLEMDEAGKKAGIPEIVFVKGGFEEHSRELAFMHTIEALGYRDLLPGAGLNTPECYFADVDEEGAQAIVIMEDLTLRGGQFGHLRITRNQDEVAQGLSLLAAYHSRTWDSPVFGPDHEYGWVLQTTPFETEAYGDRLTPEGHKKYMALPRAAAASTYFQDLDWIIDARRRIAAFSETTPHSILHGDPHPGNVFFQDNGNVAFFDIVPRRGPAMFEAAYHITLSLDPMDRPHWEKDLVRHYLAELKAHGVNPPSFEDAMFQFGVYLAEAYFLCVYNPPVVSEDTLVAPVLRLSNAMIDHDSIGLIKTIDD